MWDQGQMGLWLEKDAFAASCHFVCWAVFQAELEEKEKDVEDEWRHRPAYEEGFIPETWQMRFGNANSDEAEVNQPLSTPLFPEVDQGDV